MRALRNSVVLAALLAVSGCSGTGTNPGDLGRGSASDGPGGKTDGGSAPTQPPSSGGRSSRDVLAAPFGGQASPRFGHDAVLYAFDTLAYPTEPAELAVKLLSGRGRRPIPGATVAIYRDEYLAGRVTTQSNGIATLRWTPPQPGNYTFHARIVAVPDESHGGLLQVAPAPLLVAARPKHTRFAVIDLDCTVADGSFSRALRDGGRPMPGSVEVLERLAEQYAILYLTHRSDLLTRKSKRWLTANDYPRGPLLARELEDPLDSRRFKTAKLSELRKVYPGVAIGIGDKLPDAQACVDNGPTAYLIPHYRTEPKDMRQMARGLRRLRGRGRLHVVSGWREIEQGLFKGRSYPPGASADRLDAEAARLEAEDRRPE